MKIQPQRIQLALLMISLLAMALSLASSPVGCDGGNRDVPTVAAPTPTQNPTMQLPPPTIGPTTEFEDQEKRPPDTAEPPHSTATMPQATTRPEVDTTPRDISDLKVTASSIAVAAGPSSPDTRTVEELLEEGDHWTGLHSTHIVLRGVVTAESIRCHWTGMAILSLETSKLWTFVTGTEAAEETPAREEIEKLLQPLINPTGEGPITREGAVINHLLKGGYSEDLIQLLCYADYHVSEYLLGTGPEKVTVAYGSIFFTETGWDVIKKPTAVAMYTDEKPIDKERYEQERLRPLEEVLRTHLTHALSNRETIVFLHPASALGDLAIETWSGLAHWDVQKDHTGQLLAVRYGTNQWDPEHAQTVDELKKRVTSAAATDALAGKRLASIDDITQHYREMGAYGDITPHDDSDETFTPAKPRPSYAPGEREPVPTPTPTPRPTKAVTPTPIPTPTPATAPTPNPEDLRSPITLTAERAERRPVSDPSAYQGWNPSCENSAAVPADWDNTELTEDCTALLTAKPTLDPWNIFNWHRDVNIGTWRGVKVEGTPQRVTEINLKGPRLYGSIPKELGILTKLNVLILAHLALDGEIPEEITNLRELALLVLGYNDLTGQVPKALGNLKRLVILDMAHNLLTGGIPPELGQLDRLQMLALNNNSLTGTIPPEITAIRTLGSLRLYDNQFTGCVPPRPDNPYEVYGVPLCSAGQ